MVMKKELTILSGLLVFGFIIFAFTGSYEYIHYGKSQNLVNAAIAFLLASVTYIANKKKILE
jgi:hypothetical protein